MPLAGHLAPPRKPKGVWERAALPGPLAIKDILTDGWSPPDAGPLEEGARAEIRGFELQGSGSSSNTSDEGETWEEAMEH